jgi:site-specific recombinase XerD
MKRQYPNYKRDSSSVIEKNLSMEDAHVLQGFLTFCRTTASEHKVLGRKTEILQARDIIERPFSEWTVEDVRGFLGILNHDTRAVWTKKCIITTFQMFIKWHWPDWSSRFANLNELRKLNRQLKPNNSRRYNDSTLPTAAELDAMIRAADSLRDKLYVSMAAEAGLPPIVQLRIRWQDIKLDSPREGVTTLEYFRTKNQEGFAFPFGRMVTYYLKRWAQEFPYPNRRNDDYLFPSPTNREQPLSPNTGWYMLKRLARRAGLRKNVYQYLLRHRTLSEAYTKVTEEVHRKLFGHVRGSAQTKTYSHSSKERALQIALQNLHGLEEVSPSEKNQYEKRIAELESAFAAYRAESLKRMLQIEGRLIDAERRMVAHIRKRQ